MHPEVEELRPKLKEVLYDCAVDIRATKAALYLFDGASRFELVTEYGFKGGVRVTADHNDPLVDRCGRGRNAFFVNGIAAEPRFSELLFEASTDRLLAAPLYAKGKLIGLIDMRDKVGKHPFDNSDIPKAQSIAERLVEILIDKPIFGHRFITLSKAPTPQSRESESGEGTSNTAPPPAKEAPAPTPQRTVSVPLPVPVFFSSPAPSPPSRPAGLPRVPSLATVVIDARAIAGRIVAEPLPDTLGEQEMVAAREVLRAILLIPDAMVSAFSVFGPQGGIQEVASRSTLSEEGMSQLQAKLTVWLNRRNEAGGAVRASVQTPFGSAGPPVTAADLQKVFTAAISVGSVRGTYLTVAFGGTPDRTAHELLAVLHAHLQLVLEQSLQRGAASALQLRIAGKLVEPEFARYPDLRRHSEAVSKLCDAFGQHLALTPAEADSLRIVGLVHDVGMRLLDYDRLYRKEDLTQEELGFLREHPSVGAAVVEPLLGSEVARAVLCHHERVDGSGYPQELTGEDIPLLSRIVQICDAWVTMTDAETYQPRESNESALRTITGLAGSQFDAGLALRFVEMIRSGRVGVAPSAR